MIVLDTDVCIEILRGNRSVIRRRRASIERIGISFMTVGELFFAACKSSNPEKNTNLVEKFLITVDVQQSGEGILRKFGEVKAKLQTDGQTLADADVLIAATALCDDGILVTGNTRHYEKLEGLRIENWMRE